MTDTSMEGRVCIITGAASGMGRIVARELAIKGATIVMNDREIDEGQEARADIHKLTGNENIEFVGCDMGDFDQVRSFASNILDNYPRIHVLINNAGLTDPEYRVNKDGIEQHMAIMHLSHYLLIQLLLDRLKASAPARILQITSEAHKAGPGIDFDDMDCKKIWKGKRYSNSGAFQAYHRAKLAMVYSTHELAERLTGTGVTINAVSPGYFVSTNIFRHVRGIMKLGVKLSRPFFKDPEYAALTYIFLASSPEVEGVTGKYWEHCKEKQSSPLSHDKLLKNKVIEFTESVLTNTNVGHQTNL
jgi:NAD(P)-dependent dehydrogenase (short-subunit alcohol dehydrogenase family)